VIWRSEGNALLREADNRRMKWELRVLKNRRAMSVTPLQRREIRTAAPRGAEEEELEVRAWQ